MPGKHCSAATWFHLSLSQFFISFPKDLHFSAVLACINLLFGIHITTEIRFPCLDVLFACGIVNTLMNEWSRVEVGRVGQARQKNQSTKHLVYWRWYEN